MTPVHQDAAAIVMDVALERLRAAGESATIGIGLPQGWMPADGEHLQVDTDGGPAGPVAAWHTIRLTAWARGRSRAVELANLTRALLMTHDGSRGMQRPRGGTAVTTTRDNRTGAYMAGCVLTVPIRVRPSR